ncbi:MAG: hypothetical protein HUJ69_03925 [Lachnospiraceae bacterium]|nr:hypothetical protein [Lachnospiraceae bacterium]
MKKLDTLLNIIMGSSAGVFLGHALFKWLDYKKHPALYAAWSAPWYTSVMVYGAAALTTVAIVLVIKLILWWVKRRKNHDNSENRDPH